MEIIKKVDVENNSIKLEIIKIAKELDQWFTQEALKQIEIDIGREKAFVIYLDNRLVGFLIYKHSIPSAETEILWIGLKKEFQNKGLGTKLVERLEVEAKEKNCNRIKVTTLAETCDYTPYIQTRAFYKSIGFELEKIEKKYYPDGTDRATYVKIIR